jgi:putative ubiquitin-RnfH superfamily antitoxin RatB of RatAB toxin-antitoxin module
VMPVVTVVAALPGEQRVIEVEVAAGATAWDAVLASGALDLYAGVAPESLQVGIWSRVCARDTPLRDGDRVEIYRPLRADAKAMRRERARLKPSKPPRSAP